MAKEKAVADDWGTDTEDLQAQIQALQLQVQALLQHVSAPAAGGMSEDRLEQILGRVAKMSADAAERAANPSNKNHPGISVFSYPEGDLLRPRDELLKCPMVWCGYDIEYDIITAEEMELLNRAEPGVFDFKRTDGTIDQLTVTGERGAGGKLTKLNLSFMTQERRDTLPSMTNMLRSAFKVKSPEELELEALRREVASLKGQPEGVTA